METFVSSILDIIDKYHHQKNINKILKNLDIKVVFDIGAHKGEFIDGIMSIKQKIKVYSFEPQSKIFKILKKKFKNSKNVFLFNKAISNNNKKKILKINIKSSTSTFSNYNKNSYWKKIKEVLLTGFGKSSIIRTETTKCINLDSFCNKKKIKKIDLLKIDTEGHEEEVLRGSKKILRNVKFILIEIHFSKIYKNYNIKKIEKILKKNNFLLVKSFKFPFLTFEDRIYKKQLS